MQEIKFTPPNHKKLRKMGLTCVDMHMHTTYSDGAATVQQILEKARRLSIGVAITDHNEIEGSLEASKIAKPGDFIVPGIEVKSDELVDILFYFHSFDDLKSFFDKEILPHKKKFLHTTKTDLPLADLYDISKKHRCVAVVAHPFGYSVRASITGIFEKYEHILEKFKIFEAVNGGNNRKHNEQAVEYIKKNSKHISGGTDSHSIYPIGNVVTCSKKDTLKGFLDDVKEGKVSVYGTETKMGKIGEYFYFGKSKLLSIFKK